MNPPLRLTTPGDAPLDLDAARARAQRYSEAHAPKPQAPPPDLGTLLASVERRDRDGRVSRLTVRLASFEGHDYVRVGLEENGWPVKGRSVSIRLRELGTVVQGLLDAMDSAERNGGQDR